MPKARVFISHSAKGAEALAVRSALWEALTSAAEYEVLLDVATLQPGEGWRAQINLWLNACDAAVVLLSEDALQSPWVTYETSVLSHRSSTWDPSLLILPVVLGAVTPQSLQKSYLQAAQLDEKQLVRGTPEEIVTKVLARLGDADFSQQTPAERRAEKLADQLRGIPDDVLRNAADKVRLNLSLAATDLRLLLAVQLLAQGMSVKTGEALKVLRPHIPASERTSRVDRLIELIAASWVDLRCVSRIPKIAKGQEEPLRAFGINARSWDTAYMYILSASQDDEDLTWHPTSCTAVYGEDLGELIQEIRTALRAKLDSSEEELLLDLEALAEDQQPVVLGLEQSGITDAVLARLRAELPHVTFFLYEGQAGVGGLGLSPATFELLFPRLLENDEVTFLAQYDKFNRKYRLRA